MIEFSIRLKNWKHSHRVEIRRRDSFIILLGRQDTLDGGNQVVPPCSGSKLMRLSELQPQTATAHEL